MWYMWMLFVHGSILHLVMCIYCPNADQCHKTGQDKFLCSHSKAECVDKHCICTEKDYNLCTCLPDVAGCSIEEQSSKAVAYPSFGDRIQPLFSCTPTFLNPEYNVHILSNYEGNGNSQFKVHSAGVMNVYIELTNQDARPVVLILTSYEPVTWKLSISPRNAIINEVLMVSHYLIDSAVDYNEQIACIKRKSTSQIPRGYGNDAGGGNTVGLLYYVQEQYGTVASFTGSYRADRWDMQINGTEGNDIRLTGYRLGLGQSKSLPINKIRLAGKSRNNMHEGRVEVWYEGQWGTICDDNWDIYDAMVICQQLGYGQAIRAERAAEFGPGAGLIVLTNVDCEGHEDDIFDCALNPRRPLGDTNCQHRQDAGVVCHGECSSGNGPLEITQYIIRLVGSSESEGRVEVLFRGEWGTVCDDNWDVYDAKVVCRQLGYSDAVRHTVGAEHGQGTGVIVLDNVDCSGDESNLYECPLNPRLPLGKNNCQHSEDAGVVCLGDSPFSLKFLIGPVTFFLIVSLLCLAICCLCKVCRNTIQRRRRLASQTVQYTNGNEYQLYVGDDPSRGTPIRADDLPPSYDSVIRNSAAYPRTTAEGAPMVSPVPSTPPPSYSSPKPGEETSAFSFDGNEMVNV